jgi:hypothetical protein
MFEIKMSIGERSPIIIRNQALNIGNAENIVNVAGKPSVRFYSSNPVKAGALAGFAFSSVVIARWAVPSKDRVLLIF